MTREEAIRKIERVKNLYAYESDFEALDMAIEALQVQKTERELINRQQAIDKIKDWMKLLGYSHGERNVMECTIQMLTELPSAEPKTAKRIVGCDRNEITKWYQCDMCHEPVDEKDTFCRGCGRRFEDV